MANRRMFHLSTFLLKLLILHLQWRSDPLPRRIPWYCILCVSSGKCCPELISMSTEIATVSMCMDIGVQETVSITI